MSAMPPGIGIAVQSRVPVLPAVSFPHASCEPGSTGPTLLSRPTTTQRCCFMIRSRRRWFKWRPNPDRRRKKQRPATVACCHIAIEHMRSASFQDRLRWRLQQHRHRRDAPRRRTAASIVQRVTCRTLPIGMIPMAQACHGPRAQPRSKPLRGMLRCVAPLPPHAVATRVIPLEYPPP